MSGTALSGPLVQVQHAGLFFVPPHDDDGLTAVLKPKKPGKPKVGRVAVNKVVKDPADSSRRFERGGFVFEIHDEADQPVPGSQFTTASSGRGVCEADLEVGRTYTLVETFSPHAVAAMERRSFPMDKPNLLIRVENVLAVPAPPGIYG